MVLMLAWPSLVEARGSHCFLESASLIVASERKESLKLRLKEECTWTTKTQVTYISLLSFDSQVKGGREPWMVEIEAFSDFDT